MTYPVDTDRVAAYLKGRADAVELLTCLRTDGLAISLVTFGDLLRRLLVNRGRRLLRMLHEGRVYRTEVEEEAQLQAQHSG